jgi:hypothetical protein
MMNPEIQELYDLFQIECVENTLTEMKETELLLGVAVQGREELEQYLSERKFEALGR